MSGYCAVAPGHPVHHAYHETEYGFPIADDTALFERMVLEIMQAGLSWEIVLKKREGMRDAFDGWNLSIVAGYGEADVARLLADPRIVRNRLKVAACIENARRILAIGSQYGSFDAWIARHHPLTKPEWIKLFRRTFKFMGGEIVGEFLMSIGYLPGAHADHCPVAQRIAENGAPWMMSAPVD